MRHSPTPTAFGEIVSDDLLILHGSADSAASFALYTAMTKEKNGRNNAGDNVYHCSECVSLGKLIYLVVAWL